jgi:hypothetical protein
MNREGHPAGLALQSWRATAGGVLAIVLIAISTGAAPPSSAPDPDDGAAPSPEFNPLEVEGAPPWGFNAHEMGARAAVDRLPEPMPAFFRNARDQLAWLNPEPDRWRDRNNPEMDQAWAYDHYVDLENVPEGAMNAPDRFTFLRYLNEAGLERPERDTGFLYYRILELHERLVTAWRNWRAADEGDPRRGWFEERIVHDAGILGHYVMDASQPHHTTIHFNGWNGDTPNPEGYTTDREFHGRFERWFVDAHVDESDIRQATRMPSLALVDLPTVRRAVRDHIDESHDHVDELYRLDRDIGFNPDAPGHPEAVAFTVERISSGSSMLATLWWSAWVASGT